MNKFKKFALAMSEQLFEMRGEDLVTTILFAYPDESEQIPVDFIDGILDEDIHIAAIKERLRVELLEQVQQCPTHFVQDNTGNYVYSVEVYDYAYLVDVYIKEQYEEANPVLKTVMVCDDCGGINVQSRGWVRPNQNNEFVDLMSEEVQDNYCDDCECNVSTTTIQVDVKDPKYFIEEEELVPVTDDPKVNLVVDAVIKDLKANFGLGDYTVLEELLQMIPRKNLVQSLPEEQWKKYK